MHIWYISKCPDLTNFFNFQAFLCKLFANLHLCKWLKIDIPVPGGEKVDRDPIEEGDKLKDHQNHQKFVEWSLQLEIHWSQQEISYSYNVLFK